MSIQPISSASPAPPQLAPAHGSAGNVQAPSPTNAVNVRAQDTRVEPTAEQTGKTSPAKIRDEVQDAVKRANATVQALRSDLKFTVDETTGLDVVKFVDIKTKEVIRQIPSEEMLALARRLDEIKGLLIKDKA